MPRARVCCPWVVLSYTTVAIRVPLMSAALRMIATFVGGEVEQRIRDTPRFPPPAKWPPILIYQTNLYSHHTPVTYIVRTWVGKLGRMYKCKFTDVECSAEYSRLELVARIDASLIALMESSRGSSCNRSASVTLGFSPISIVLMQRCDDQLQLLH